MQPARQRLLDDPAWIDADGQSQISLIRNVKLRVDREAWSGNLQIEDSKSTIPNLHLAIFS